MEREEVKNMKKLTFAAAVAGMGLLLGATLTFAGDLEVTVVTVDGKKIREGVIYASDQAVKIGSGGGKTIIRGIPEQRTAVTADVRVGKSGGKDDLRYVGVDEGFPAKGTPDAVKITVKPVKDINAFCSECHPSRGEPVKRGQIPRDIHASGKELTGRYLEQAGEIPGVHREVAQRAQGPAPRADRSRGAPRQGERQGGQEVLLHVRELPHAALEDAVDEVLAGGLPRDGHPLRRMPLLG